MRLMCAAASSVNKVPSTIDGVFPSTDGDTPPARSSHRVRPPVVPPSVDEEIDSSKGSIQFEREYLRHLMSIHGCFYMLVTREHG